MQADVGSLFKDIEDCNTKIRSFEIWKRSVCISFIKFMVLLILLQWPISLVYSFLYLL